MSLISSLFAVRAAPRKYPSWMLRAATSERHSLPSLDTVTNQEQLYQRLSWVHIAVSTIAEAAALQQLNVKEMVGEDTKDIPNHPFEQLLRRPSPLYSRYMLLYATFAYLTLTGNAYWWLNKPNEASPPDEIWIIPSHQIEPVPDGRMYIKHYEYRPGGFQRAVELPTHEIVHFKQFHPRSSFVGLSRIEPLAQVAKADLAMQEWNREFFADNHAKVPGALAFADMIPDSLWERLKADLRREHGGTKRNLMMLRGVGQGGVQWIATNMNHDDMEFLQGRQFNKEEVLATFGIPPGMLDKNATEANAQVAKAAFAEYTLWPALVNVAETISNDVLPLYGENLIAEFDDPRKSDRLVDLQELQEYARYHTIDEVRAEHYGHDPLGDERGRMLAAQIGPQVPVPAAAPASAPEQERPAEEEPVQERDDGRPKATILEFDAAKAELRRWRDKVRKRGKPADWEPEVLPRPFRAGRATGSGAL